MSTMSFAGAAGAKSGFGDLIPNGQLAFAILHIREIKKSKSSDGHYLDCELTIDDFLSPGVAMPFARKKIFTKIGDPNDPANSEKYRQMGFGQLGRILECGNNAGPHNVAGYELPVWPHPDGYQTVNYSVLNGKRVAIKIKVEKGQNGYEDKNDVADFLSPNPASDSNKAYAKLMAGQFNLTAPATPLNTGFGGGSPAAFPPPSQTGGFPASAAAATSSVASATPATLSPTLPLSGNGPTTGFGAAPAAQPATAAGLTAPGPTATTAASPSEAAPAAAGWGAPQGAPGAAGPATSAWLQQANGQV